MSEWQCSRHESEQSTSQLQIVCHRQFSHDNAANFRAGVALVLLELNFVAAVGLTPVDGALKKGKQDGEMLLFAALIHVLEQVQDVLVLKEAGADTFSREVEETRQILLSYLGI